VVNIRDGVVPIDLEIADILRRTQKPVVLAANKADHDRHLRNAVEFWELGLGEPIPVSSHHGRGTAELLDTVVTVLPSPTGIPMEVISNEVKIAIVGRPNVGKSMLVNCLLRKHRTIVSEFPGTTRDAVDTHLINQGRDFLLIDTAGIRRRGKQTGVEYFSVLRSLLAIQRCDVAVLVLDSIDLTTAQDLHVAGLIQKAFKGAIIVVNKWDLVVNGTSTEYTRCIMNQMKFMPYATILYTSALTGRGTNKILPEAVRVHQQRQMRLPTATVNEVIQAAVASHVLVRRGRRLKVLYVTQPSINPPTFVFFVNDARLVHFSYQRFLENKLRQAFGFAGTPIRLVFKSRGEV
jgi:GTP-binding protein